MTRPHPPHIPRSKRNIHPQPPFQKQKLIRRNDCQYVCLWEEDQLDLRQPVLSVESLLRAATERQQRQQQEREQRRLAALQERQGQEEEQEQGEGGGAGFLEHVTAFFDQLVGSNRALETVR